MSVTVEKEGKWLALICPHCDFVYRVSSAHTGQGVFCPSCHRLCIIPARDKPALLPVVVSQENEEQHEEAGELEPPESAVPVNTGHDVADANSKSDFIISPWLLVVAVLCFIGSVVGGVVLLQSNQGDEVTVKSTYQDEFDKRELALEQQKKGIVAEAEAIDGNVIDHVRLSALTTKEYSTIVAVIEGFLKVGEVEDLRPYVKDYDAMKTELKKFYKGKEINTREFRELVSKTEATKYKNYVALLVRFKDFSTEQIVLQYLDGRYVVDWESWVAKCDVPWDDIIKNRSSESVLVRANCKIDSYFNGEFSDRSKYMCISLNHPDSYKTIYGYVAVDDIMIHDLTRIFQSSSQSRLSLKIRFSENTSSINQVWIEEIVSRRWIIE